MSRIAADWYDFVAPHYEAARIYPASHDRTLAGAGDSFPRAQLETASDYSRFLGVSSQPGPAAVRDGRADFFAFSDMWVER